MTRVTFRYTLSEAYRTAHFIETGEALASTATIEVEFTEAAPAERAGYAVYTKVLSEGGYSQQPHNLIPLDQLAVRVDGAHLDDVSAWTTKFQTFAPAAFDHELEPREVFAIIGAYNADALSVKRSQAITSKQLERQQFRAKEERLRLEREAQAEERRQREAERERIEHERAEALRTERRTWVEEHGSAYLKKAVAADYDCQRLYVTERAAQELPDFVVDFGDTAVWRDRSCPSESALDESIALNAAGRDSFVVWLTRPVNDTDDAYGEFDPCEAIVVRDYLGKYHAVKIV